VKGIQVGAGLSLILSAGSTLLQPLHWVHPVADNLLWALFAFLLLLFTAKIRRFPYALVIFLLGLIISLILTTKSRSRLPHFHVWQPRIDIPSPSAFKTGFFDAGLGQLPLTTLNSIIAVSALSADLLPNISTPSVTRIGFSVAAMNLIGGWFGAMPVCHGSGGLAAQYRFGARSGASVILLGLFKLILGLVFGESLVDLLKRYPNGLLGIMVLAAGIELSKVGENLNYGARDLWAWGPDGFGDRGEGPRLKVRKELSEEDRMERWMVMFFTVGGLLAFKNDGVGFLAGMLCHWSYEIARKVRVHSEEEPLLSGDRDD
jgi:hypothetical protein